MGIPALASSAWSYRNLLFRHGRGDTSLLNGELPDRAGASCICPALQISLSHADL